MFERRLGQRLNGAANDFQPHHAVQCGAAADNDCQHHYGATAVLLQDHNGTAAPLQYCSTTSAPAVPQLAIKVPLQYQ